MNSNNMILKSITLFLLNMFFQVQVHSIERFTGSFELFRKSSKNTGQTAFEMLKQGDETAFTCNMKIECIVPGTGSGTGQIRVNTVCLPSLKVVTVKNLFRENLIKVATQPHNPQERTFISRTQLAKDMNVDATITWHDDITVSVYGSLKNFSIFKAGSYLFYDGDLVTPVSNKIKLKSKIVKLAAFHYSQHQ